MEINTIEGFVAYYSRIKGRTRALFGHIPDDKVEWTYEEGKFTIGDIVRHLALTERYMYVENVRQQPSSYDGCGEQFAKGLEAITQLYDRLHAESIEILSQLSEDDLARKCETPGGHIITVWKLLRAMAEHEIHHRGVLYTYLGFLKVVTPPIFGLTSEEVIQHSKS